MDSQGYQYPNDLQSVDVEMVDFDDEEVDDGGSDIDVDDGGMDVDEIDDSDGAAGDKEEL